MKLDKLLENKISNKKKVIILGGGPNRIGQGIEFDYCCVHAAYSLSEENIETIMINCNPETVSTDYDTSDKLYFEPLTLEDILEIVKVENSKGNFRPYYSVWWSNTFKAYQNYLKNIKFLLLVPLQILLT